MRKQTLAGWVGGFVVAAVVLPAGAEMSSGLLTRLDWPGITTVWKYGTMYLASEPDAHGLEQAKHAGVETVINLMGSSEQSGDAMPAEKPWYESAFEFFLPELKPWDEAETAKSLGLRYEHVPVSVDHPSEEAVARFLSVVNEVNARQLLIHCDAAGRALAMWAIYMGTCQGCTPEESVLLAERAGLTHQGLKQFVLEYLRAHPPQSA